mmetsp:Transcript_13987/g.12361  ORF Transcript_13987/g.12361 Transcript_13987/m.12361 type:complete len:100 (+) Transcript_13987:871-1170(+)
MSRDTYDRSNYHINLQDSGDLLWRSLSRNNGNVGNGNGSVKTQRDLREVRLLDSVCKDKVDVKRLSRNFMKRLERDLDMEDKEVEVNSWKKVRFREKKI